MLNCVNAQLHFTRLSTRHTKLFAQTDSAATAGAKAFQDELNKEYKDPKESPLDSAERVSFTEHAFYPIDLKYRVTATFKRTKNEKVFKMKTTGTRTPDYVKYGEVKFKIDGKRYKLNVYQSQDLIKQAQYKDFLFLPFTDNTNGVETYGGGRYIDLKIPSGNSIVIDFNKAYNPYCAYSHRYSCPIPPKENHLDTDVRAGVKLSVTPQ